MKFFNKLNKKKPENRLSQSMNTKNILESLENIDV